MAYASKFEFLKRTFNKETNRDEPVDAEPEYFIQLELRQKAQQEEEQRL